MEALGVKKLLLQKFPFVPSAMCLMLAACVWSIFCLVQVKLEVIHAFCFLWTPIREFLSLNIWYCLKAGKKEIKEKRKKMRAEALHEKAISRQGNEDLVFSQRKEHLRKTEKKKT